MSQFSYFKGGIKSVKTYSVLDLSGLHKLLLGESYAATCERIRNTQKTSVKRVLKESLDYVTVSGTFKGTRNEKNLLKHSGLIAMDFDHVADFGNMVARLKKDKYSALVFVSPSGEGIKVIVKIDPTKHLDSFNGLSSYYQKSYGLTVDASGKDVCRACFLSHDPTAQLNEAAEVFRPLPPAAPTTPPPSQPTPPTPPTLSSDKVAHIAAVVQRIEDNGVDITSDYSDEWLLIGFSLSTIGEDGRELFHRISRQNPAYSEKDCNQKFDNFLATSRFENPAKFFKIAKKYGVDVSKPKAERVKETKSVMEKILDANAAEKFEYSVNYWYDEYRITVRTGKSYAQIADNFLVYIKYMTKDEQDNISWILEIRQHKTEPIYIELPHEDFCSASKLRKALASESLSLKITDSQLAELHGFLFGKKGYKKAIKVIRYGFHPDSTAFFFSNVVLYQGKRLQPDNFGIVEVGDYFLSMPTSKAARLKRYELTGHQYSFNKFYPLYAQAHGYENAFIPVCFYVFSLFRDIAIKEKNFSPILFLKGGAGTGKSSMARILTAMFGRKQEGVNLKSKNTEASLVKIMSQASNQIVWFDEYSNDFAHEGLLQAMYDNDGYHRSSDTNSIDTNSVEIYSALALTSNYLPDNPIFFSRCLFVPITSQSKTDEQRAAFYQLEQLQEEGLGCITEELLSQRPLLENDIFGEAYRQLYAEFRKVFNKESIPERLMANMSQVMAAAYILQIAGSVSIVAAEFADSDEAVLSEFVRIGETYIRKQHRIMSESKAIAEFFEIVQTLYDTFQIHPDFHFRFTDMGETISLNFSKLYNLFAPRYRQIFQKTPPDRDTIQTELATLVGMNSWEEISKSVRFHNEGEGNVASRTMPVKGSCSIPYNVLVKSFGLDLTQRVQKEMPQNSGDFYRK